MIYDFVAVRGTCEAADMPARIVQPGSRTSSGAVLRRELSFLDGDPSCEFSQSRVAGGGVDRCCCCGGLGCGVEGGCQGGEDAGPLLSARTLTHTRQGLLNWQWLGFPCWPGPRVDVTSRKVQGRCAFRPIPLVRVLVCPKGSGALAVRARPLSAIRSSGHPSTRFGSLPNLHGQPSRPRPRC